MKSRTQTLYFANWRIVNIMPGYFPPQQLAAGCSSRKLNFNGLNSEAGLAGGRHLSIARQAVCRRPR
jgi:hypothetical protein